jgi:hypothetical protein
MAIESKQLIELWTAETRNFSPANVRFRHLPAELPVSTEYVSTEYWG